MGYREKNLLKVFLLAGVGVLACALAGALCGCGSNDTQVSRQDKKPAATASARPLVKEVLRDKNPTVFEAPRVLKQTDPGTIEEVPPVRPGERGITQAEMETRARAADDERLDPSRIEVVPPIKPGERGLTQEELSSKAAVGG